MIFIKSYNESKSNKLSITITKNGIINLNKLESILSKNGIDTTNSYDTKENRVSIYTSSQHKKVFLRAKRAYNLSPVLDIIKNNFINTCKIDKKRNIIDIDLISIKNTNHLEEYENNIDDIFVYLTDIGFKIEYVNGKYENEYFQSYSEEFTAKEIILKHKDEEDEDEEVDYNTLDAMIKLETFIKSQNLSKTIRSIITKLENLGLNVYFNYVRFTYFEFIVYLK